MTTGLYMLVISTAIATGVICLIIWLGTYLGGE